MTQQNEFHPLRRWAAVSLNAGFAMTGFATVLLGCMLPAISASWNADDSHAGRLMAAQFAGSAAGALLPGRDFRRSALHGYLLVIITAVALAASGYLSRVTLLLQGFLFLCLGLGLGWAMTSTSLLVGTLFRRKRGTALSLLNASWTIGAAVCPFVATQWAARYKPTTIFLPLCGVFLLVHLSIQLSTRGYRKEEAIGAISITSKANRALILFAILAFLYVGVESSVSGWMITFVHRDGQSLGSFWAPLAASSFWLAVLCGRLLAPALLLVIAERRLFSGGLVIALAGLTMLISSVAPAMIVIAAFICGLALGPIFPLCISWCLELNGESPNTRYIFALSGFGGAVLPWLTGLASSDSHSLRRALSIPLLSLCGMVLLAWMVSRVASGAKKILTAT